MFQWDNNEVTSETLIQFTKDDPLFYAQYAIDNDIKDTGGWKRFRSITNDQKKLKGYEPLKYQLGICVFLPVKGQHLVQGDWN